MANQAVIDLIARTLPTGLQHPGDETTPPRVIPLPGFSTTGMSDAQAQEMVGQSATLVAEALTALLETQYEIMSKDEAQQLRQAAADAPTGTIVNSIKTTPTGDPVLMQTIDLRTTVNNVVTSIIPASVLTTVAAKL